MNFKFYNKKAILGGVIATGGVIAIAYIAANKAKQKQKNKQIKSETLASIISDLNNISEKISDLEQKKILKTDYIRDI